MRDGPLAGVRVLDLTHALAGPYTTMLLSDLGADVVKIEPPDGDLSRRAGPFPPDDVDKHFGGYFQSVNRGKRSVMLNLKSMDGAAVFRRLAREADVVVENFTPGVMERFGLDYESLSRENPRLIYAALRGFGDRRSGSSPYQEWPAFDIVIQAMAGIMGITGTEDGAPIKVGPGVGDIFPGTMLALGIVAALYEARASGRGQFVDIAMFDAVLSLCERIVYQYSYTGVAPRPEGNKHPLLSPFDVIEVSDGWVAIAAPGDSRWRRLCEIIERPDLAADPSLATNEGRSARRDDVTEALLQWAQNRTRHEIFDLLGGEVPVGTVQNAEEILSDDHVRARQMVLEVDHPGSAGRYLIAGQPLKFSRTPARPSGRAPILDEQGERIRSSPDQTWPPET